MGHIAQLRQETLQPGDALHLPYVGLEHIDQGDTALRRCGKAEEVTSTKNRFCAGDVLYGKLRPYLDKAVLAQNAGMCSTDILVLRATEHALAGFLVLLLHTQALRDHAVANTNGVNHPRTSWQALSGFSFRLPPLPEQRAIARILRAVQAAREARQREVSLERERKAALMAHLFTYGTRGEPTKQTPIGEMPENWGVVALSEVSEFLQYGTSKACTSEAIGLPVLRIPNVVGGRVDTDDLKYLEPGKDEADKLRLAFGDILFVRTNGRREYTGRCAVFMGEPREALFASYLIRARLKPNTLLPQFLQFYATTPRGSSYLAGRASNAADGKFNINTQTINSVLAPQPTLDEQNEIVEVINACDAKIAALERESSLLDELFRALLEELMTGRLSVAPLTGSATSGLTDRILIKRSSRR